VEDKQTWRLLAMREYLEAEEAKPIEGSGN
jgi:hypothetical protein